MSNYCPRNVMQHRDRRCRQSIYSFPPGTTFEVFGPPAYKKDMELHNKMAMRARDILRKDDGFPDVYASSKSFSMYDSD